MRSSDRLPKTTVGSEDRRTRHPEYNTVGRRPVRPPGTLGVGRWALLVLGLAISLLAAPGWANEQPVQNDGSAGRIAKSGEVPEGLSAEAWEAMQKAIERNRYRTETLNDGTVRAANDAQNYSTRFTPRGIRLRPRGTEIDVELALTGYGYSEMQAVEPAEPRTEGNRVEFHRGALRGGTSTGRRGWSKASPSRRPPRAPAAQMPSQGPCGWS